MHQDYCNDHLTNFLSSFPNAFASAFIEVIITIIAKCNLCNIYTAYIYFKCLYLLNYGNVIYSVMFSQKSSLPRNSERIDSTAVWTTRWSLVFSKDEDPAWKKQAKTKRTFVLPVTDKCKTGIGVKALLIHRCEPVRRNREELHIETIL